MNISFQSELWIYAGENAWHFITVPKEYSESIRLFSSVNKRGFGAVKVEITIGETTWQTSIFPDSKSESFLLPVKKEVRENEHLVSGDTISVSLDIFEKI